MHSLEWYKKNFEFYRSACYAQIERIKKLEKMVGELQSVVHLQNSVSELKKPNRRAKTVKKDKNI